MEELQNYLNTVRRDFADQPLLKSSVHESPIKQFEVWFEEAINSKLLDPYAMSVSTVSEFGQPSTRIVYMRNISEEGFVFYTNYNSDKGGNIKQNNKVSLNFFWGELERQVRVEGEAIKLLPEVSDAYFANRPRESQIGAWASDQSETLISREELEEKVIIFTKKFKDIEIPRPDHWGGYLVQPSKIEFWQGRPSRLHDRLIYININNEWKINRVSP